MQKIPLTAHAECVDGPCGELAGLVIRADSRTLEYYVVRDVSPGQPIERLVDRARVDPAATNGIHLDCTLAELHKMQPLNVQEVTTSGGRYGVEDSERAPDGTGVLRPDQHVEATDGKIGKLSSITIDDAARITDFSTRLDRHGSPELLLPSSAVDYVDRTTVYLLLDKHHLDSPPPGEQPQQERPWWRFWDQ